MPADAGATDEWQKSRKNYPQFQERLRGSLGYQAILCQPLGYQSSWHQEILHPLLPHQVLNKTKQPLNRAPQVQQVGRGRQMSQLRAAVFNHQEKQQD